MRRCAVVWIFIVALQIHNLPNVHDDTGCVSSAGCRCRQVGKGK
jgi:hypothetical protein